MQKSAKVKEQNMFLYEITASLPYILSTNIYHIFKPGACWPVAGAHLVSYN